MTSLDQSVGSKRLQENISRTARELEHMREGDNDYALGDVRQVERAFLDLTEQRDRLTNRGQSV